jgi:hypothetical protein
MGHDLIYTEVQGVSNTICSTMQRDRQCFLPVPAVRLDQYQTFSISILIFTGFASVS